MGFDGIEEVVETGDGDATLTDVEAEVAVEDETV